ncbi:MAG: transcription antitermination factor NusB [Gemmatimonadota bacterium]|nr:transcription antitermination factor NusB [Gemmatimonadota bacterium]
MTRRGVGPAAAAGAGRPPDAHRRRTAAASPRAAAREVLRDVRQGAYADRSAERRLGRLAGPDRGLAMELAYGAIRLRGRLDAELSRLVDRPLDRLDPDLLDWLRLGLFQLRETRVPPHAAVNETVEGARRELGAGASGLANAVLRRAAAEGRRPDAFPDRGGDPAGWLAAWGSHPRWLVERWLGRWPEADVERLVAHDNRPPGVVLRLLRTDGDPAGAAAGGAARDVDGADPRWPGLAPVEGHPRSVRVTGGSPATALDALDAVAQDPAASAVAEFACAEARGPFVDVCAAPGGKTAVVGAMAPAARPLVAADVSARRLRRALDTFARTGTPARAVVMDGRRSAFTGAGTVFVDTPCSGTGVLRRRPDARWRLSPRRLRSLIDLQARILDGCAAAVAPGGRLVYATCSLEPEENEAQVEAFLARHPQFRREPGDGPWRWGGERTKAGDLRFLPFRHGTDGAFASRLRRKGEAE